MIVHSELINTKILELNETELITNLSKCYFLYELKNELLGFIQLVIKEWDFIDANVSEEEFTRLLWYSCYVGKDHELVDKSSVSHKFLGLQKAEVQLYVAFHDIVNGKKELDKIKIESLKKKMALFNNYEKVILFDFIDDMLTEYEEELQAKAKTIPATKSVVGAEKGNGSKNLFLEEISKLSDSCKNKPVKNKEAFLAIYSSETSSSVHYHVPVNVQHYGDGLEYFISKKQLNKLKNDENGNWITINYKNYKNELQKRERIQLIEEPKLQKSQKAIPVIQTKPISANQLEEIDINSQSALRDLGYQITGLTRAKRWEILSQKAVPKLGLKKVVDIIAFLVRGRKK